MSNDNCPVVCSVYAQKPINAYAFKRCFTNTYYESDKVKEEIIGFIHETKSYMSMRENGFSMTRIVVRRPSLSYRMYLVFERVFEDKVAYHKYKLKNPKDSVMIERDTKEVAEFLTPTPAMEKTSFEGYPVYFY